MGPGAAEAFHNCRALLTVVEEGRVIQRKDPKKKVGLSAAFLILRKFFKPQSRKVQGKDKVFVFLNHKSICIFPLGP